MPLYSRDTEWFNNFLRIVRVFSGTLLFKNKYIRFKFVVIKRLILKSYEMRGSVASIHSTVKQPLVYEINEIK